MTGTQHSRRLGQIQAILIFIVLQVGWFSCVLGAAWGLGWLGPVVVAVLAVLHLLYSRSWRRDLQLMVILAVVGTVLDSLHAATGFIRFAGQPEPWLAPPWITALWLHFATMRHAILRLLYGRPWTAALCGAVGGPLAYLGGAALGAADLVAPSWRAIVVLAAVWAVMMPWASHLAWRGTRLDRDWT